MIIQRIEVRDYRKFRQPLAINLKSGLSVIAGDNEAGKSTLLNALYSLFFVRHNASGQSVKDMMPYDAEVKPQVACEFTLEGRHYRLVKTFSTKANKGSARLESGNTVLEGSAVEDKLQELFLWDAGRKASEVDMGIWSMLWLLQTQSIKSINAGGKARETIAGAVEGELGKMLGGTNGDELLKIIDTRFAEYFTPGKKKKQKPLGDLAQRVTDLTAQLEKADFELRGYSSKVDQYLAKEDEKSRHRQERTKELAEKELTELQKQLDELKQLQRDIEICQGKVKSIDSQRQAARQAIDKRNAQRADISSTSSAILVQQETLAKLKGDLEQAQTDRAEQEGKCEEHQSKLEKARAARIDLERAAERAAFVSEHKKQSDLLARVEQLETELAEKTKQRDAIAITAANVTMLRNLEKEAQQAQTRLESASTRVKIVPAAGQKVFLDGTELKEKKREITLSAPGVLKLDGWGEIEISPGGEDLDKRQADAQDKQNKLQSLLERLQVASCDEAQELANQRVGISAERDALANQIKALVPESKNVLSKNVETLQQNLEMFESEELPENDPSALAALKNEIQNLEMEEKFVQAQVTKCRDKLTHSQAGMAGAESKINLLLQQLEGLQKALADDSERISDKELDDNFTGANELLLVEQKQLDLLQTSLATRKPNAINDAFQIARAKRDRVNKTLEDLDKDLSNLEGALEALGQRGLQEERDRLQADLLLAQAELTAVERNADATFLLWETMNNAAAEARQQVLLPLAKRLTPYVESVIPGAQLELNHNSLDIVNLERSGLAESFDDLSIGTREQLSVLTRLAMADLLSSKALPALVILDDALVYSDDGRFERMKKALVQAAQMYQIIVLTCRPRDYKDLEASVLVQLSDCVKPGTATSV